MRLVRFTVHHETRIRTGMIGEDGLYHEVTGDIFGPYNKTGRVFAANQVSLDPPCVPSKIVAVGVNYKDHADEMKHDLPGEPLLFMKATTSVIPDGEKIVCPDISRRVDYEAELAVVIGRKARRVSREEALDYVLGYTCLNDVTARDLQKKDGQWIRAKSFDTFCPLGPCIVTDLDPSDLAVESFVNGEPRQASRTSNLIFNVPALIEYITRAMTLLPGDVIATGTPSGVGPVKPGDKVEVRLEGIGSLINPVVGE